jgi:Tol biopolymer transport system component
MDTYAGHPKDAATPEWDWAKLAALAHTAEGEARQLIWLDRKGTSLGTAGSPGLYNRLALSPDGRQVAVQVGNENQPSNLWLIEFQRGTSTRVTFNSNTDLDPLWLPDSSQIAFSSNRNGHFDLYQKAASGGGTEQAVFQSGDSKFITDISHDGRWLLFTQNGRTSGNDLWILPMKGDRQPLPYVNTEFAERSTILSELSHGICFQVHHGGAELAGRFEEMSAT